MTGPELSERCIALLIAHERCQGSSRPSWALLTDEEQHAWSALAQGLPPTAYLLRAEALTGDLVPSGPLDLETLGPLVLRRSR